MTDEAPTALRNLARAPQNTLLLSNWSRRYHRPLLRFFSRRLPPGSDCEDLVQEVFLRLAKRDRLSEIQQVDSYLFQTAASVLSDWRRKQITHAAGAHDPIDESLPEVDASAERVLMAKDDLERLIGIVQSMPEKTRMIFVLYHFEGFPHAEIAKSMGVAIRTVENHIARANALISGIRPDQEA